MDRTTKVVHKSWQKPQKNPMMPNAKARRTRADLAEGAEEAKVVEELGKPWRAQFPFGPSTPQERRS